MATRFNDDELKRLADQYGVRVSAENKNKFSGNLNKVLGVNVITSEPYLTSVLNAFNITNASLIKKHIRNGTTANRAIYSSWLYSRFTMGRDCKRDYR